MAYVNEYVSENEINEYGLDALLAEFHQFEWRNGRPSGFMHTWTIDRNSGAFLVKVKTVQEVGPSGRPEPTTRDVFILLVKGSRVQATFDHAGGSRTFEDNPFIVVRKLVSMDVEGEISQLDARQMLKDSLVVYGYQGALVPVENTVVAVYF